MARRIIQLPVQIQIPKRRKDGSVKLEFITTSEVSTQDYMELDTYRMGEGYLLYAENRFSDADIPTDDAPSDMKSQSQRLRAVLFLYHKQQGGKNEDFQPFYNLKMEQFINKVKDQLEG